MARKIGVGTVFIPPKSHEYVRMVLKTKRLSYGPYSERFEKLFSKIHQVKYSLLVNSGTSALQVALHALKLKHAWQAGDEVLVPALTFVSTVNVIIQNGLRPVFVDVYPDYFDMNAELIAKHVGKRTKAIMIAHLFGQCAKMDHISTLAKRFRLKLIEDSCETMFAKQGNRMVGSWGDAACFSTYSAHLVTTGVGGIISTNDKQLATLCRSLINHGRDPSYWRLEDDDLKGKKLTRVVKKRFQFLYSGYSYRLSELEPALGLAQLEGYDQIIKQRHKNATYLSQKLKNLNEELVTPKIRSGSSHDFMVYPLVLKKVRFKLSALRNYLEQRGIETRELLPLLNQPVYRDLEIKLAKYPVAKKLSTQGFYIGCHQDLTRRDLEYIVKTLNDYFANRGAKLAIIVPTYNEEGNIISLLKQLTRELPQAKIIVVDGSSHDRTAVLTNEFSRTNNRVYLVNERNKNGRGQAVKMGLKRALRDKRCRVFVEMDADLSHDPKEVYSLVSASGDETVVVASRYLPKSRIVNWPAWRLRQSRMANWLISFVLGLDMSDNTNGFRCYSRKAALIPNRHRYVSHGFIALSESAYLLKTKGFGFRELPSVFRDRRFGRSSAGIYEVLISLVNLFRIRTGIL